MPNRSTASTPADVPILYLLKQIDMAVRARMDDMFRPAGVTVLQYSTLTVLERQPNLTSAQLARTSFVTAQTMADLVRSLENHGFVERHVDPDDRRRLVLMLTSSGRRLLRRFRGKVSALEDEMLAGLSRTRSAQLRESLVACRTALAAHPPR